MLTNTPNYALGRPARQSSLSAEWSRGKTIQEEAGGANNGDLNVDYGCHTGMEQNPWWQVNLGSVIAVQRVVIFNRRDCAYRLRYFSLYHSMDGKTWERFFRKKDEFVFGRHDDAPYTVEPAKLVLAKYVRLELDGYDVLHFKEIEVYGTPVTEADRAILKKNEELALKRRRALLKDRKGSLIRISRQLVFVDTENYSETIINALWQGTYDQIQRRLVETLLHPADRILEIGTGIGVVTMVAAYITSPEQVRTFDRDPEIIAAVTMNFALNEMENIKATAGILKCRNNFKSSCGFEKSHAASNFWAARSGVEEQDQDVPVFCLEDEIQSHAANVLIIDMEGGEVDLLQGAELRGIRLIILAAHYGVAGREKTDAMVRYVMMAGFNIDLECTGHGIVVMRRGNSLRPEFSAKPRRFWLF